jgi:glycine/D-amino acid oxidase-like deaminating enzyme
MSKIQRRDLRQGPTPWEKDLPLPIETTLGRDIRCDVLIVGGGISGALLAEALSSRSLSIVLVDRRGISRGSTAASTAMVEFELDTPLIVLQEQIGKSRAERIYRRSLRAVADLMRKLERLSIHCEQSPRETLYLSGKKLGAEAMVEETEARRTLSLPSRYLNREEVQAQFGISRDGAILSAASAQLNPVKMTAALIEIARRRGVRVFEQQEIIDFSPGLKSVLAQTKSGRTFEASSLIFATGYELPDRVTRAGYNVTSTWAIATRPQQSLWLREVMITEAEEPYLYVRAMDDGRVIAGGEDEPSGDSEIREEEFAAKIATIQEKLKRMLPYLDVTVDFAWTGAFGMSETGLPLIGKIPGCPRCYAVVGFGGNGTTFSAIAADLIPSDIMGEPDADAELFAFQELATTTP